MTDLTPLLPEGRQIIEAYGEGGFRISGAVYRGSVLVFPDRVQEWPVATFAALDEAAFAPLLAARQAGLVDLVLLGTGSEMRRLPRGLSEALRKSGLIVESMTTGAACRTYNVLLSEGRRVALALLPV